MARAGGLQPISIPNRGSSQNKLAATCIIAVTNFKFSHIILPNGKIAEQHKNKILLGVWTLIYLWSVDSLWALPGKTKTAFRVHFHRNRRNCLDGPQFFLQKIIGFSGLNQFQDGMKRKQVTHRIARCQLAWAADPTSPSSTGYVICLTTLKFGSQLILKIM